MVKPLKPWPSPAVSAKPAETPSDVFYAVVVYDRRDSAPKKANSRRRNDFDHYVSLFSSLPSNSSPSWEFADKPILFTTLAEAEKLREDVSSFYSDEEAVQPFIQTFRLIESYWHAGDTNNWQCRINDALRAAESLLTYNTASEQIKKLAGKVLTILDAAYVNENQNKAVKDLVKSSFRSQLSDLWKIAYADPNGVDGDCCKGEGTKDILD